MSKVTPYSNETAYFPLYEIRQILLPPSSLTSRLPSGIWSADTGRPQTSGLSGESIQPVTKSRGGPLGLPLSNGTKATSYPWRWARFQEPCHTRNAPPSYSLGNILPV